MTSLMRREPYGELESVNQAMNRFLDDSLVRSSRSADIAPALDMYETDNEYVIKIDVAGADPEGIEVRLVGDGLTIKGEIKSDGEVNGRTYIWRERRSGQFIRALQVPQGGDASQLSAEYDSGVLTLIVPKAEETKPKSIQIKVK